MERTTRYGSCLPVTTIGAPNSHEYRRATRPPVPTGPLLQSDRRRHRLGRADAPGGADEPAQVAGSVFTGSHPDADHSRSSGATVAVSGRHRGSRRRENRHRFPPPRTPPPLWKPPRLDWPCIESPLVTPPMVETAERAPAAPD